MMTCTTFIGAGLPTEPNTGVTTRKHFGADPEAWIPIAGLMAQLGAALMGALPSTGLLAGCTGLATSLGAGTMHTAVLT